MTDYLSEFGFLSPSTPPETPRQTGLEQYYQALHDKGTGVAEIRRTLGQILEPVGNVQDCFWISHAWAESMIQGQTVAKSNFPHGKVQVREDSDYRRGQPDYRGRHVSWGAEPALITDWTRGTERNLKAREYRRLLHIDGKPGLKRHLVELPNGTLTMLLINPNDIKDGHALLAAHLNGEVVMIDNSMEPGPWVKTWKEFEERDMRVPLYDVYDYPEKIFSF